MNLNKTNEQRREFARRVAAMFERVEATTEAVASLLRPLTTGAEHPASTSGEQSTARYIDRTANELIASLGELRRDMLRPVEPAAHDSIDPFGVED